MKTVFAAAILFAAAYAMEEEHSDADHEEEKKVILRTDFAFPTAEKSVNKIYGQYWSDVNAAGDLSLYVGFRGETSEGNAFPSSGYWMFNYLAVQRPGVQPAAPAAERRLADEEVEAPAEAQDSVWDALTSGQKMIAKDGDVGRVVEAVNRE